jgi:hypothetical protein
MFNRQPARNRKLYAGEKIYDLTEEFYPENTIEVNGESFHKNHLYDIYRNLDLKSDKFHQIEAFLRAEPENPHDPNAVAVIIQDEKVGYINHHEAPFFRDVLESAGGVVWVLAAIKHVSEINQYRVRLLVSMPPQFDPRAHSFLDLSDLESMTVFKTDPVPHPLDWISWRTEQMSPQVTLKFAGPYSALFTCVSTAEADSVIRMIGPGGAIFDLSVDDNPDLFDALLDVNQAAWLSVSFLDDGSDRYFSMFFNAEEGLPRIDTLSPSAEWWQPDADEL